MNLQYINFIEDYPEAKSMTLKTFTDVIRDFNRRYNSCISQFHYSDESELNEIMSDIYDIEEGMFTIDYDNEIIAIPKF